MSSPNPATRAFDVTASDTVDFSQGLSRALYVGTGGDVAVVMVSGNAVVFRNVQAGSVLPVQAKRVNATGTTASNILGLY